MLMHESGGNLPLFNLCDGGKFRFLKSHPKGSTPMSATETWLMRYYAHRKILRLPLAIILQATTEHSTGDRDGRNEEDEAD